MKNNLRLMCYIMFSCVYKRSVSLCFNFASYKNTIQVTLNFNLFISFCSISVKMDVWMIFSLIHITHVFVSVYTKSWMVGNPVSTHWVRKKSAFKFLSSCFIERMNLNNLSFYLRLHHSESCDRRYAVGM